MSDDEYGMRKIPVAVTILDKETGVRSVYHTEDYTHASNDHVWDDFIWSEGNYSCDCNRSWFHARGIGAEELDDPPCGHGRFWIVSIVDERTGEELYSEDVDE